MITKERLRIAMPYILLATFGNIYAFYLPLQVLVNRYLEALNTGSLQGLLMNLYSAGTGINGIITAAGITALAYLLPVIDPTLMQAAADSHFQGSTGTIAYVMGLALASYILWGIGRSFLHFHESRMKKSSNMNSYKSASGLAKHKNLLIPMIGIAIYGLFGWFGAIPLTFGMIREIAYKK